MVQEYTAVQKEANWAARVRSEQLAANGFMDEWGFMCSHDKPAQSGHQTVVTTAKYGTGPNMQIRQIRVLENVDPAKPADTTQSMESVLLSSAMVRGSMEATSPCYSTSSSSYGSRHNIEFGIGSSGRKAAFTSSFCK
ncbi:hypothetical protein FOA52_014789 [Chlamydomonas sp. UWO 241]|nr:hypothetical protein FOA52_014789 [Chlamydomonas sp. UWO 241]